MSRHQDFLKRVPIFSKLPDEALQEIGEALTTVRFAKNSVIFDQGDPGDAMYLVLVGRVKVVLYSETGREVILAQLGPGDCFGEMAVIAEQPRSAHVIALEDVSLLSLTRKAFVDIVRRSPDIALNLLRLMTDRLTEADEKIGNLALVDVYGRVARYLLKLARERGRPAEGGTIIENRPTHQEIANIVGASRETVSRSVSDFIRQGCVRIEGKTLVLLDGDRLASDFDSP